MKTQNTQSRELVARQVIHALDNGVKIVDDIAKGKQPTKCRPARQGLAELYAFAEKYKDKERLQYEPAR